MRRLTLSETADFLSKALRSHQTREVTAILAIDGRCASGKTTLAAAVAEHLSSPVFHMDDFYLRMKQRTAARYATPGGTIDHERFRVEVLEPLACGRSFVYWPMRHLLPGDPVYVKPTRFAVVEGAYSCLPSLAPFYAATVFLDAPWGMRLRRLYRRDGPERLKTFLCRWIPYEERYFKAFDIERTCDVALCTTALA